MASDRNLVIWFRNLGTRVNMHPIGVMLILWLRWIMPGLCFPSFKLRISPGRLRHSHWYIRNNMVGWCGMSKTGILVDEFDIAGMSAGILRCTGFADDYGRAGHLRAKELYTWRGERDRLRTWLGV